LGIKEGTFVKVLGKEPLSMADHKGRYYILYLNHTTLQVFCQPHLLFAKLCAIF